MPETHAARVRVRYAETDQMGVVYHSNYLVWMEVGRVEYWRAKGMSYRDFEQRTGLHLAVAEVGCRYLAPARYDDEVVVSTWVGEAHPRMVTFRYELTNGATGQTLATGFTKHVFLGKDLKPRRLEAPDQALFGIEDPGR